MILAMPRPLHAQAMLAAGLLALTGAHALHLHWARAVSDAPLATPLPSREDASAGSVRRCAIYHARFGGTRAWLARVVAADVANYIVMEVSKGSRVVPTVQFAWLHGAFGGAEALWLGEFASAERALAKAVRLCPQTMRCRIGEVNCGPHAGPLPPADMPSQSGIMFDADAIPGSAPATE